MARTAITVTALTIDVGKDVANATVSTNVDQANGMYFATDGRTSRYLIHVKNTNGSNRVMTIKAPVTTLQYEAFRQGLGDLAITVAATSGEQMVSVGSSRFVQPGGNVNIDFAASFAGTIAVYKIPDVI